MYIDIYSYAIDVRFDILDDDRFDIPEFKSSDYDTFMEITGLDLSITLMPKVKNYITFEFHDEVESGEESTEKKITYQLLKQLANELNCRFEEDIVKDSTIGLSWYVWLQIDDFNGFNF